MIKSFIKKYFPERYSKYMIWNGEIVPKREVYCDTYISPKHRFVHSTIYKGG